MNRVLAACALTVLVAGCSSEETEDPSTVSFTMTTTLPPGTEAEHCKFVVGPADGMYINRDHVDYTEGSHHFLLYSTQYEEIPTSKLDGTPIAYLDEEQGVFDCSEGVQFGYSVTNLIGGSQNADGDSMVNLPPGVAVPVAPNAVMLMNAHYINASGAELKPEVVINFDTIEKEDVQVEGGVLFWYNVFIEAKSMASSYATARCTVPDDITITNTQSHMHARGVAYEATVPDGASARMLYEGTSWENVPVATHDPGFDVKGGTAVEWTCDYDNPTPTDIVQGPRSTNEMCMLIGSYYPARPEVSLCSGKDSDPFVTSFLGAEWIGQGATNCNDSWTCTQAALTNTTGGMFAVLGEVTKCVNASDPAVSPELSAAIGCVLSTFSTGGDVVADCAGPVVACTAK